VLHEQFTIGTTPDEKLLSSLKRTKTTRRYDSFGAEEFLFAHGVVEF
jgi:hypothetical protein